MRLTHGYREAVGLFALFLLLGSSTAQDVPYIPVDVNDLNPLDTCNRVDARSISYHFPLVGSRAELRSNSDRLEQHCIYLWRSKHGSERDV